jgi:Tol biopolymer transport system component/DNA-binding winged helix-turn-helix (wHTH) protein
MASPLPASPKIKFGAFELDASAGRLFKSGIPIKLQPQPLRVLLLLTQRSGQVVTREEIQRCLWGNSTFVDFERGINFSINQIRGALSDNAEKPRYIETLPRVGYRFIAELSGNVASESAKTTTAPTSVSGKLYDWPSETTLASAGASAVPLSHRSQRKRIVVLVIAMAATCVLGTTYGLRRWYSRSHSLDLQSMQITRLTDTGTAEDVAISPDGRYVVYALRDGEEQGLWLRHVATKSVVQILAPDTNAFHGLTFSPDGEYIYFVRSDKNDPFFKYLYSMPVLGGTPRKLIDDVDSPVSFSPDGHQFVYEHCIPARNDLELRIVQIDGSGERLLTTLHNASCFLFQPGLNWSPDGRTVAVPASLVSKPSRWVLDAVSVPDGGVRELLSSTDAIGRPIWLPGGSNLLVSRYDPQYHRAQLWVVSFPGGEARRFTNDLTRYSAALDITQDGRIITTVAGTVASNLWVASANDPLTGRQITFSEPPMFDVAENQDGRILSVSGDGELWATNPDGSQRVSFGEIGNSGWVTPCGRFVLFMSYKPGFSVLTRVSSDGSHPTELARGNLWSPACSPDGQFVFYVNFDQPQKIWRLPVEGGNSIEIAQILGDGICGRLSASPDGKFLVYPDDQYTGVQAPGWNLIVIRANGSQPVKTFEVPGGIGDTRWSPDGKALQYLLTRNGATNIWEQMLAGGEPKQLTKFTSGLIFDFHWSSDRTKLLLSRGSISRDVVLLRNLR